LKHSAWKSDMEFFRRRNSVDHVDSALAGERRAAALLEEHDRQVVRQRDIDAQSAPQSDPQVRIATWERLHDLRLPRSPTHALIRVIARQTGLTVREVRAEQERRSGADVSLMGGDERADGGASKEPR